MGMLEFYSFRHAAILLLSMVSAVCMTAQTIAMSVTLNRHKNRIVLWIESITEGFILLQVLILALLISQVRVNIESPIIADAGFVTARYLLFSAIVLLSSIISVLRQKNRLLLRLLPVFAATLTLPFTEALTGRLYPFIYTIALAFWLVRSVYICFTRRKEVAHRVSTFSIKQAMDSLRTGLLYYDARGRIYLTNRRMQGLMIILTGEVQRNGLTFVKKIDGDDTLVKPDPFELDGHKVFSLPDGTAWLFRICTLEVGRRQYFQLSAAEITDRLQLTYKQQAYVDELKLRGEMIAEAIENLDAVCREEELLRISSEIHDNIAQQLAMMTRILRLKETPDEALLIEYASDILNGWQNAQTESGTETITAIQKAYAGIGVEVMFEGKLPGNRAHAGYFADFVREGVANAVRHGFATEVFVRCSETDDCVKMSVENKHGTAKGVFAEGGGITGLRRKVDALGGSLEIAASPHFTLTAVIGIREKYEGGVTNEF